MSESQHFGGAKATSRNENRGGYFHGQTSLIEEIMNNTMQMALITKSSNCFVHNKLNETIVAGIIQDSPRSSSVTKYTVTTPPSSTSHDWPPHCNPNSTLTRSSSWD